MSLLIKQIAENQGKRDKKRRNTNHDILITEKGICRAGLACHLKSLAIKTNKMWVSNDNAVKSESCLGDEAINEIGWARDSAVHGNNSGRIGDGDSSGCEGFVGVIS